MGCGWVGVCVCINMCVCVCVCMYIYWTPTFNIKICSIKFFTETYRNILGCAPRSHTHIKRFFFHIHDFNVFFPNIFLSYTHTPNASLAFIT